MTPYDTGAARLQKTLEQATEKIVRPQLKNSHFMWTRFLQKDGTKVNSRKLEIPIKLRPSAMGTFLGENEALPNNYPEVEEMMKVGYTDFYKGYSFTAQELEQSKQKTALVKTAERLKSYRMEITKELSRHFHGVGDGSLAKVTSGNGSGVLTVQTAGSGVGTMGSTFLEIGSLVNIVTSNLATIRTIASNSETDFRITAKTGTTVTIVDSAGVGVPLATSTSAVSNGDLVVPAGTVLAGVSRAFHGIDYHLVRASQAEYQVLSAATYPELESVIKDLAGAPLTVGAAEFLEDAVLFRRDNESTGNEDNTLIVCNVGQRARLKTALNSLREYTSNEKTLKVGGREVENQYGNKWEVDTFCFEDRVLHLKEDDFAMTKNVDLSFVDNANGGNMVLAHTSSRGGRIHRYDGWFRMEFDFFGYEPRNQAALLGLETTGTIRASDWVR